MTDRTEPLNWQELLERALRTLRPSGFEREAASETDLPPLTRAGLGDIIGVNVLTLAVAAMAATFDQPPAEARNALQQIGAALADLPEAQEGEAVAPERQALYKEYASLVRFMFRGIGPALVAMFTRYVDEDYAPDAAPDHLVEQARDLADADPAAALSLLDEAGVVALRGADLWRGWPDELAGELGDRALAIQTILENLPPLDALEVEREQWRAGYGKQAAPEAEPAPPKEDSLKPLLDQLYGGADALTPELRAAIAAHGEAAAHRLIDLLLDRDLWDEGSTGGGFAPVHAARLLGDLQAAEAAEPLLEVFLELGLDDALWDAAADALERLGPVAAPALLRFMRYSRDVQAKVNLAGLLSSAGQGMDAAYAALAALYAETAWDDSRNQVVDALGALGDRRAVPLLQAALAEPDVAGWDRRAVLSALRDLGEQTDEAPEDVPVPKTSAEQFAELFSPQAFRNFLSGTPPAEQRQAERLASVFVQFLENTLIYTLARSTASMAGELTASFAALIQGQVERAQFAADTSGWAKWERAAWDQLQRAWPEFNERFLALSMAFGDLALREYDPDGDPNKLLAEARAAFDEDAGQALEFFSQAGALALGGKPLWRRWPAAMPPVLAQWTDALLTALELTQNLRLWPLQPPAPDAIPSADQVDRKTLPEAVEALPKPTAADRAFLDDLLRLASPDLPEAMLARLDSLSPALWPDLARLISDEKSWDRSRPPGFGWPPMNAIAVAGHLRLAEAASPLIEIAAAFESDNYEPYERLIEALGRIGPPAAEQLLWEMQYGQNLKAQVALAQPLAAAGRGDLAAAPALIALFDRVSWRDGRARVARALGQLKDPRAVTPLRRALEDRRARPADLEAVWAALAALGEMPPARLERLRGSPPLPRPRPPARVPRNAPCPCGSGKKYKHCHGAAHRDVN